MPLASVLLVSRQAIRIPAVCAVFLAAATAGQAQILSIPAFAGDVSESFEGFAPGPVGTPFWIMSLVQQVGVPAGDNATIAKPAALGFGLGSSSAFAAGLSAQPQMARSSSGSTTAAPARRASLFSSRIPVRNSAVPSARSRREPRR